MNSGDRPEAGPGWELGVINLKVHFFLRVREFFVLHRIVGRLQRGVLTPGYFERCNFPSVWFNVSQIIQIRWQRWQFPANGQSAGKQDKVPDLGVLGQPWDTGGWWRPQEEGGWRTVLPGHMRTPWHPGFVLPDPKGNCKNQICFAIPSLFTV